MVKKHPLLLLDTGINKDRLMGNFIKLTTLFSVFYILVSWMIGFLPGVIVMSFNTLLFLLNLWLYVKKYASFKVSANFYIANCMFIAILLCSYFSGGIYSPVLPWFILIPTISLLLLGICNTTLFWLVLTVLVVVTYGVLGQFGYTYPNLYHHQFWDKIFTTTCIFGLVLIVYLVTYIFETITQSTLHKLSEKNKEITDSIHYARNIQRAMLSPTESFDRYLPQNFVLYKPKDIVSGDFYWTKEHEGRFYLAVCDCTGHGVPGAFMSLLMTGFLNEAISERNIQSPHEILNFVRNRVIENTAKNITQDGMDGVIVQLDKITGVLRYSSANGHMLHVRDGELVKLSKDKMPVGLSAKMPPFTLHKLTLKKGDMVYFYTDGFPDLFGGPKGKKYTTRQLNRQLLMSSHLSIEAQKQELEDLYVRWKGDLEQIDDICIVGFRY